MTYTEKIEKLSNQILEKCRDIRKMQAEHKNWAEKIWPLFLHWQQTT